MDIAKAPRRLKVMTAAGEWRTPTCSLIPGCPAATRIMSLLLERWLRGSHHLLSNCLGPVLG